ncbi:MAG: hypothetical protein M5U12_03715 [Verrucomicrobia bacterium]|nr:hypothetical protein [Verrucomicrobiota bacterium]
MNRLLCFTGCLAIAGGCALTVAQVYDITTFDPASKGPWAYRGKTTLVVPKVAKGSITLDGAASAAEYGGFAGIEVVPGLGDQGAGNARPGAWILDFPEDRVWDGPEDSGFTYWLAHDDDYLYVGVHVKDDVVVSDNPNAAFWNDDSIEIVVDALNDRFDNNTDNSKDAFGGHCYVNYQGRFSAWDDAAGQISGESWATGVNWKYGPNEDIFGFGKAVAGGWQMETRFHKRLFEDPARGNKLKDGYRMGFNIGLDDDDQQGPSAGGWRTFDLEVQYFWANRERLQGYTADLVASLTPEAIAGKWYLFDGSVTPGVVNSTGRLAHGGTGEILFAYDTPKRGRILFVTATTDGDNAPINADPALIALLQARGYTVTVFAAGGSTPESLRTAAQGQDVVLISETIGSTSVVDPAGSATGVFSLKDVDVPVISFEAYMFDNADWVERTPDGSNDFIHWGNSGRTDLADPAIQDGRDSLFIRKPTHPIAAGLPEGPVQVYNVLYSLTFGLPSADADVVASIQPDGSYPTIFVYDKGDRLVDGSIAPNKRIGFFLGQNAVPSCDWALDYADLTDAARTLLFNTIEYCLPAATPPTLAIARSGANVVITYAGGVLQSAAALAGAPWQDEPGIASGAAIQPAGAGKFYRVRQ